jgi:hypothetical protein
MKMELNPAEQELLLEIVESRYRELLLEVRHAHHHRDFREELRKKQTMLESVIEKLRSEQPALP